MRIGGIRKVSLIDYPGQISAVIFTQGCNFNCPYCHNPELVDPLLWGKAEDTELILKFLSERFGKLDAVTVTGGEPALQQDLQIFIEEIKRLGYLIKLDTNGSFPQITKNLIDAGDVDFVAMDIKAPLDKYTAVTCSKVETS
ncbi:MAG: anaerobic ribonucleoside-triphosphate reductase activating protein, partial [Syntrophales bacterium]|nr:anaerobic ribonucleoside-triphosphate reductase activating protein [Syntrophales bacterium]